MSFDKGAGQEEVFETDVMLRGRTFFMPPYSRKNVWTLSRLMKLDDGTPMPVLRVLAREKFGDWDENTHYPIWTDGDWHRELIENVSLVERGANSVAPRRSSFGVPSGTKEYRRLWREANKERVREKQKEYHARKKENIARIREELQSMRVNGSHTISTAQSLFERLEGLVEGEEPPDGSEIP